MSVPASEVTLSAFASTASPSTSADSANFYKAITNRWMSWLVTRVRLSETSSRGEQCASIIVALAIATLVRWLVDPLLGERAVYVTYVLATGFIAWRYGLVPALFTITIGAVLARFFFESPRLSLLTEVAYNHISLVLSLMIATMTAVFCESLRIAAREQARSAQLAREADARKDQFLAMLGHELRNPLAPIRNALYLLESVECHDPTLPQLREMISCQIDHLSRMVDDLLDVSRVTRGKIDLEIERLDVKTIVDAAVELTRPLMHERRHQLHVDIPADQFFLNADLLRLTQVFVNLFNNAAKYTLPGGHVWITAESIGNEVAIRVRDSGVGMTPEMCVKAFDLFEQADQTIERSQGGLGVGLTIVRWLVELHGGSVAAESPGIGKGSQFTVRLPAAPRPAPRTVNTVQQTSQTTVVSPARSLRILVVEDLPDSATSLAAVLKLWKHEVEVRFDGVSALEKARTFIPDVVLTDLGLPQMNGFQLAEELRRLPGLENTVLIAVSGYGQPADRQHSESVGFSRHLIKPLDLRELKKILHETADSAH